MTHDGMVLTRHLRGWISECECGEVFAGTRIGAMAGWMSHWHDKNPDGER